MKELFSELQLLYRELRQKKKELHNRRVSFGDLITDRWENAQFYGFGKGSSCYDNVLIIGDVKVGENTWIGPNVILDGSGGLEIGDFCSISAGVQIYSHSSAEWSHSMGSEPIKRCATKIGSGVYIGPQSIIEMGVTIGDRSTVGALSLVRQSIPCDSKAFGIPATLQK